MAPTHPFNAAVIGATGGIGAPLVRQLVRDKHSVRTVSRRGQTPTGISGADTALVSPLAADAADPAQLRDAIAGADVVFWLAQPEYTRWPQEFPALTTALIAAMRGAQARLVVMDNFYGYGQVDQPMTEATPTRAADRKGMVRAEIARQLLHAHRQGQFQVALARAGSYYGPGGINSNLGMPLWSALLTGSPVQLAGNPDMPQTFSYTPDIARALTVLAGDDRAFGRAWHLPADRPITTTVLVHAAATAAGIDPAGVTIQTADLATLQQLAEHVPYLAEIADIYHHLDRPYTASHQQFTNTFGAFSLTPHEEALNTTAQWWQTNLSALTTQAPPT